MASPCASFPVCCILILFSFLSTPIAAQSVVLTSTSGCAYTSPTIGAVGCHMETDAVTIHGRGFTALTGGGIGYRNSVYMHLNDLGTWVDIVNASAPTGLGLTVVNDTVLLLTLSTLQQPSLDYFNASILSNLSFGGANYNTNKVTLSFAPLSGPPIVNRLSATEHPYSPYFPTYPYQGCTINNTLSDMANLTDCYPSYYSADLFYSRYITTALKVYGPNLFNGTMSLYQPMLGSIPCLQDPSVNIDPYPRYLVCSIPAVAGNTPGMRYDLIVQTPTGRTTVPSVFSFANQPVVTSVERCYNDQLPASLESYLSRKGCPPGAILTVRGMNFPALDTPVVTCRSQYNRNVTVTCLTPKVVNGGMITCTLPTPANGTELDFYAQYCTLSVQFADSGALSNITAIVYTFPNMPIITSITSGCFSMNGPLSLSQCRARDVLTISGQHFKPPGGEELYGLIPFEQFDAPSCSLYAYRDTNTDSQLRCKFDWFNPYADPDRVFNVSLTYVLRCGIGPHSSSWQSNPFLISFINVTASNSAVSSHSLSTHYGRMIRLLLSAAITTLYITVVS